MRDAPMHLEAMLGELLRHDADETHPRILSLRAAIAALQSQRDGAQGGEAVACHRLHTPNGKWMWIDGPPAQGALDDAKNFGWTMEYAYTRPAIAPQATPAAVDDAAVERLADHLGGVGSPKRLYAPLHSYNREAQLRIAREYLTAALAPQSAQGERRFVECPHCHGWARNG